MGLQLVVQVTGQHVQGKLKDGPYFWQRNKRKDSPWVRVSRGWGNKQAILKKGGAWYGSGSTGRRPVGR
ncbi:hypothetical protein hamaS1_30000 [Moorella sp. Hama-1]|nr:hypothetical protein hamaS1_30000 [Moorella sp. Hama-1]